MKYDYLVVGAGLYGSTIANLLANNNKRVLIIDKRQIFGGNCSTIKYDDYYIHVHGAHIFHTSNKEVWDFVNKFSKFNNFINSPKAVYYNHLYSLPFNMNTFYEIFNVKTKLEAIKILENEKIKFENPSNLEEQALSLVGKTIYEKLIKHYTEKQWGKSCKELSPDIIKRIPVRFTYNNNYFNDEYQGIPVDGYSKLVENILKHSNITVKLGIDFLQNRTELEKICNKIIYTGSIDEYYAYRYGKLQYRSLNFEHKLYIDDFQSMPVKNYTDNLVKYTRTIEHKYFTKDSKSTNSVVSFEYPCMYNGNNERYYPLQDKVNLELYQKYVNIKNNKVFFGGRLGKYKYFDMDKTILEAMNDFEVLKNE